MFNHLAVYQSMKVLFGSLIIIPMGIYMFKDVNSFFQREITQTLKFYFLVSILLMYLHKYECFVGEEYLTCSAFKLQKGDKIRKQLFITFCGTFLLMLLAIGLIIYGDIWPRLLLFIWILQLSSEVHHFKKKKVAGKYTAFLITVFNLLFFYPTWFGGQKDKEVNLFFYLFYFYQSVLFLVI